MNVPTLMKTLTAAILALSLCATDCFAQPGGRPQRGFQQDRGPGGPRGFGGRGNRAEDLLRRDDVAKELNLTESQKKQLEALSERQREGGRELFEGLRDLSREERDAKVRELFAKREKETQQQINGILNAQQSQRLNQLIAQSRARGGATQAILDRELSQELGITEQQEGELRKTADQLREEMEEKMRQLRAEMDAKMLNSLTPQQRAKWNEMMGKPFEFQRTERDNREGRFGGPGQRGGRPEGPGNRGRRPDDAPQRQQRPGQDIEL